MKLDSLTSAVSAWNKKIQETRAHCHDRTRPGLARAGNKRPNLEVFLEISPPVGGRTPGPGLPTRWVCYDRPVGKVRTILWLNPQPGRHTWLAPQSRTPRDREQGINMVPAGCRRWQGPEMAHGSDLRTGASPHRVWARPVLDCCAPTGRNSSAQGEALSVDLRESGRFCQSCPRALQHAH